MQVKSLQAMSRSSSLRTCKLVHRYNGPLLWKHLKRTEAAFLLLSRKKPSHLPEDSTWFFFGERPVAHLLKNKTSLFGKHSGGTKLLPLVNLLPFFSPVLDSCAVPPSADPKPSPSYEGLDTWKKKRKNPPLPSGLLFPPGKHSRTQRNLCKFTAATYFALPNYEKSDATRIREEIQTGDIKSKVRKGKCVTFKYIFVMTRPCKKWKLVPQFNFP